MGLMLRWANDFRAVFWVVVIGAIFTLARFSEAFLVLRVQAGGLPLAFVPLVLIVMNLVYAAAAYPFGKMADTMSHQSLLLLIAADLALAWDGQWGVAWLGIMLWGLHLAMMRRRKAVTQYGVESLDTANQRVKESAESDDR